MVDYKKFDHIGDDDSDEDEVRIQPQPPDPSLLQQYSSNSPPSELGQSSLGKLNSSSPTIATTTITAAATTSAPPAPTALAKKGKEGRIKFEYEGRTIYEWEQGLTEVNIYIEPPPGLPRKLIDIVISPRHLLVGVAGSAPFIDEATGGPVKPDESLWTLVDGEININLQKMNKAEAWDCALAGQAGAKLDDFTKEETRKKLLLERFQEENPGFDFSGAEFNGQVPDAREFMGGVKHF